MIRKDTGNMDFLDTNQINYKTLQTDLMENHKGSMNWLLDEFQLQFDGLLDDINKRAEARLEVLAEKLTPYFQKHLSDDNRQVREFAKTGLDEIKQRFPDMIK